MMFEINNDELVEDHSELVNELIKNYSHKSDVKFETTESLDVGGPFYQADSAP